MHCAGTSECASCLFFANFSLHFVMTWSFFMKMAYLCCSFVIVQIFFEKDALLFFLVPMTTLWLSKRQSAAILLLGFFTEWMCRDSRRCFMHKRDFCLANVPILLLEKFILFLFLSNLHFCGATQFSPCDDSLHHGSLGVLVFNLLCTLQRSFTRFVDLIF